MSLFPICKTALAGLLALTLGACSSTPSVLVDYDTTQDLTLLKSYRWASEIELRSQKPAEDSTDTVTKPSLRPNQKVIHNYLLTKRITRAVNDNLRSKMLSISNDSVDFVIDHEVISQTNTYRDTYYYDPFGIDIGYYGSRFERCDQTGRRCFGTGLSSHLYEQTREYTVNQLFLVLRFISPANQQLIWKGVVSIPSNSVDQTALEYDAKIAQAVNAVLKQFPNPLN